jgi:hypothetical protein
MGMRNNNMNNYFNGQYYSNFQWIYIIFIFIIILVINILCFI